MNLAATKLAVGFCGLLPAWAPLASASEPSLDGPASDAGLPRGGVDAAVLRGATVFGHYCVTCHGLNADGTGRAARLYNPRPANLRTSFRTDNYKEMIIRKGGAAMGRSEFMPNWDGELSNEQILDTIAYLRAINLSHR